jgi:hypothetical protein
MRGVAVPAGVLGRVFAGAVLAEWEQSEVGNVRWCPSASAVVSSGTAPSYHSMFNMVHKVCEYGFGY